MIITLEVTFNSVIHDDELASWRNDFENFIVVKLIRIYRFVKVAIIKHNSMWIGVGYLEVLVEGEFQLRVPLQIAFHLDTAFDHGVNGVPRRVEENWKFFNNIHEYLIFLLLVIRYWLGGFWGGNGVGNHLHSSGLNKRRQLRTHLNWLADDVRLNLLGRSKLRVSLLLITTQSRSFHPKSHKWEWSFSESTPHLSLPQNP